MAKYFLGATLVIATAACVSSGPNDVTETVTQVGVNYDTLDSEQSETAIVWSSAFLVQVLVAGYNDASWSNDPATPREWDFSSVPPVVRRGASLMGRSISVDFGTTWEYHGKIYPPPGWSLFYGDPSLAVDPNNRNIVYYANLAADKAHWDSQNGGQDFIPLDTFDPTRENGVCVAKSVDSGVTFGTPACITIDAAAPAVSGTCDRTAITVGGDGRVYVATIDTFTDMVKHHIRVFRTTVPGDITTFADASLPLSFSGQLGPRLRTDLSGDVWLGSNDVLTMAGVGRGVLLARFASGSASWTNVVEANTICRVPQTNQDDQVGIGGTLLRNAHEYDFDVGADENNNAMLGVVWQLPRSPSDSRRYIQGARIRADLVSCDAPPFTNFSATPFNTFSSSGTQMQPSISFQPRRATAAFGGVPDNQWWVTYYTSQYSPDNTAAYVEAEGDRFNMASQVVQFPTVLTPTSWYACPNGSYWGDYIDLTTIRDQLGNWFSVSAFSSSLGAPPCSASGGEPMGVAATRF